MKKDVKDVKNMKNVKNVKNLKHAAEPVLLLVQILVFYVCPLAAGPTDVIGLVLLMLAATLVISLLLGGLSNHWGKFVWPLIVAAAFLPSVFIWYNSSAMIHSVWYMALAAAGVLAGSCLRKCIHKRTEENES